MQKILLIGGGHAHVQVLKELVSVPLPDCRLTVVTDRKYAVYSGMVPGFVADQYDRRDVEIDVERLAGEAGARFVLSRATRVDASGQRIALEEGNWLSYDLVSLDIGSTVAGLDLPGVREFSVPTRPIDRFIDKLDEILEKAQSSSSTDAFRVTVVGGGAGGVEVAFTLQQRLRRILSDNLHVLLLESGNRILKGYPESLRQRVCRNARERGIVIRCQSRVARLDRGSILLESGDDIPSDCTVWVTGAVSQPIFRTSGLPTDKRGFVSTRPTLQVQGEDRIFAVGDCATLTDFPHTPKAGVYAVRQGPYLAHNLRASLSRRPLRDYEPQSDFLTLLNLGDGSALGSKWGISFEGRWVMRLKDRIDRRFMNRFPRPA